MHRLAAINTCATAKLSVAMSRSQGTNALKAADGVSSNNSAPARPQIRLMIDRTGKSRRHSSDMFLRLSGNAQALTNCPGNNTTVLDAFVRLEESQRAGVREISRRRLPAN